MKNEKLEQTKANLIKEIKRLKSFDEFDKFLSTLASKYLQTQMSKVSMTDLIKGALKKQ